jgi:myosin heavy subunit
MASYNNSDNSNSSSRLKNYGIAAIIALLGINGVLLFNNYNKNQVIELKDNSIAETEKVKAELEKQYYQSLSDLEQMKGSNAELNSLIDKQKQELAVSKEKISRALSTGKATKKDLEAARLQITGLVSQVSQYKSQITSLEEDKKNLTAKTVALTEEKGKLESNIQNISKEKEDVIAAKAMIEADKSKLEAEREVLSKKVGIGSVVKLDAITVSTFEINKKGQEENAKKAKNINRVKVCFKTSANKVVDASNEKFYVRILNPLGETLAIEELGSGVFKGGENDQQIRYTMATEVDYKNDAADGCAQWTPNTVFAKGNYEVEVYNKGYLCGKSSFMMK